MEKNRRRPGEPQLLKFNVQKKIVLTGAFSFLLGIIVRGILYYYHNDHTIILDQACPALNGTIFSFVAAMGNLLLVIGLIDLSVGGFIPRFIYLTKRNNEAICCGHMFMGLFGQVLKWIFYFIVIGYNVKGTGLMIKSLNKSLVKTTRNEAQAEAFCDPVVLNLARTVNALIYLSLIAYISFTLMVCYKLVRSRKPGSGKTTAETIQTRGISQRQSKLNQLPWAGFTPVRYAPQDYLDISDEEDLDEEDLDDLLSDLPDSQEEDPSEDESQEEEEEEDESQEEEDEDEDEE